MIVTPAPNGTAWPPRVSVRSAAVKVDALIASENLTSSVCTGTLRGVVTGPSCSTVGGVKSSTATVKVAVNGWPLSARTTFRVP